MINEFSQLISIKSLECNNYKHDEYSKYKYCGDFFDRLLLVLELNSKSAYTLLILELLNATHY